MQDNNKDTFITIKLAKERFKGIPSTASFMRLMRKLRIPYYKPSNKTVLFDEKIFDMRVKAWKDEQDRLNNGLRG